MNERCGFPGPSQGMDSRAQHCPWLPLIVARTLNSFGRGCTGGRVLQPLLSLENVGHIEVFEFSIRIHKAKVSGSTLLDPRPTLRVPKWGSRLGRCGFWACSVPQSCTKTPVSFAHLKRIVEPPGTEYSRTYPRAWVS